MTALETEKFIMLIPLENIKNYLMMEQFLKMNITEKKDEPQGIDVSMYSISINHQKKVIRFTTVNQTNVFITKHYLYHAIICVISSILECDNSGIVVCQKYTPTSSYKSELAKEADVSTKEC